MNEFENLLKNTTKTILPPKQFRFVYQPYNDHTQSIDDAKQIQILELEQIQYELKFSKCDKQKGTYQFAIKHLVPQSERIPYQAYFKNQKGKRITKVKNSLTKVEVTIENKDQVEDQTQLFLAYMTNNTKIILSNEVNVQN